MLCPHLILNYRNKQLITLLLKQAIERRTVMFQAGAKSRVRLLKYTQRIQLRYIEGKVLELFNDKNWLCAKQ